MGEIAVLHPQIFFKDRLTYNRHNSFVNSNFSSTKSKSTPVSNSNYGSNKSNRRKRSLQKNSGNSNTCRGRGGSLSSSPPEKNGRLVMGQVKILKRGEVLMVSLKDGLEKKIDGNGEVNPPSLKETAENREVNDCAGKSENDDMALSSTDRLGPEPNMVPKQMKISELYAGSAFISSPPPSSLPVPAFFTKKSVLADSNDDDASIGLRRLLKLDPL